MRQAPDFWRHRGLASTLLLPAAVVFSLVGRLRRARTAPFAASVPVLCIGNLVAGGAGKTPVALALARKLSEAGRRPHLLTRGYGGALAGPVQVDPARHDYSQVGDEALLLAEAAPCWVARDRAAGARAAATAGAEIILMDDGLQNPSLRQDSALLVVDGGYGFGNGRIIPAGPLRERLQDCLPRLRAAVLIGEDRHDVAGLLAPHVPLIRAWLAAEDAASWRGRPVVPFAGIGRPQKFFDTLVELGTDIKAVREWPDHHPYQAAELAELADVAARRGATLVTTAKDQVRLPPAFRDRVAVLKVVLAWATPADEALIDRVLAELRP
jgi:tetraacyldisaccharide 4'-kinase